MTEPRSFATEQKMMELVDWFAETLAQPVDPRAWDHLLIYCPREALERRLQNLQHNDGDRGQ